MDLSRVCGGCYMTFDSDATLLRHQPTCNMVNAILQPHVPNVESGVGLANHLIQGGETFNAFNTNTENLPQETFVEIGKNGRKVKSKRRKRLDVYDLPCRFCGKMFNATQSLKQHERVHTGEKPFKCNVCGLCFGQASGLRQHSVKHSDQKFHCAECDSSFCTRNYLQRHMKMHNNELEKPFKCETCGKAFSMRWGLKRHRQMHVAESAFQCNKCDKTFLFAWKLEKHLLTHASGANSAGTENNSATRNRGSQLPITDQTNVDVIAKKKAAAALPHSQNPTNSGDPRGFDSVNKGKSQNRFRCDLCKKSFFTKFYLLRHKKSHENGVKRQQHFVCEKCGKTFEKHFPYKMHMMRHKTKKAFPCGFCSKSFLTKYHLKAHILTHEDSINSSDIEAKIEELYRKSEPNPEMKSSTNVNKKNFKCAECGRAFERKNVLICHMRRHTGEKPFMCDQCDESFATKAGLKQHAVKHSEEKIQCDVCQRCFCTKYYLNKHKRFVHEGVKRQKPFQCDKCDRTFEARYTLIRHKSVHEERTPFQCAHCDKQFSWSWGLKSHLLTHQNTGVVMPGNQPALPHQNTKVAQESGGVLQQSHDAHTKHELKPETTDEILSQDEETCSVDDKNSSNEEKKYSAQISPKDELVENPSDNEDRQGFNIVQNENQDSTSMDYETFGIIDSEQFPQENKIDPNREILFEFNSVNVKEEIPSDAAEYIPTEETPLAEGLTNIKQEPNDDSTSDRIEFVIGTECQDMDIKGELVSEAPVTDAQGQEYKVTTESEETEQDNSSSEKSRSHITQITRDVFSKSDVTSRVKRKRRRRGAEKETFECEDCGKTFDRERRYQEHRRIHTGEKPFECAECGLRFRQISGLRQHSIKHSGEAIECDICDKSFCTKFYLARHKVTHSDVRATPFKCNFCDKAFELKETLKRHMVVHGEGKLYKCAICEKIFNWSHSYKKPHAHPQS